MDPDDPEPPPANARWVEDLGYVVPGPPPKPDPVAEGADEEDAGAGSPDGSG